MRSRLRALAAAAALALVPALAACSHGIEGTYTGGTFFESLRFKSGGKVDVTFMGQTKEIAYEVKGDQVVIDNEGETHAFTIDRDGCLDGGGLVGRYCKDANASASSSSSAERASGGGSLSGTYVASESDGTTLTIKFQSGGKLRFEMAGEGQSDGMDGTYTLDGKRVTVQTQKGFPLQLTLEGSALVGNVFGEPVRFEKR